MFFLYRYMFNEIICEYMETTPLIFVCDLLTFSYLLGITFGSSTVESK